MLSDSTIKRLADALRELEDREQRDEALLRQAPEALKAENARLARIDAALGDE